MSNYCPHTMEARTLARQHNVCPLCQSASIARLEDQCRQNEQWRDGMMKAYGAYEEKITRLEAELREAVEDKENNYQQTLATITCLEQNIQHLEVQRELLDYLMNAMRLEKERFKYETAPMLIQHGYPGADLAKAAITKEPTP